MACLDTTVFIDLQGRGGSSPKAAAEQKLAQLIQHDQNITTTRFNLAELYVGLAFSKDAQAEAKAINQLISDFEILDFDDHAAFIFGQIKAHLRRAGRPSGDMDVLIAATAMSNGHTLITRNVPHFQHIPNLMIEDY
jgi:tRNA(fMet)-specific endonuclease VapC